MSNTDYKQRKNDLRLTEELLLLCEETQQFPFSGRKMLNVGEIGLAMAGIIRFVLGNDAFRLGLSLEHQGFILDMTKVLEPGNRLSPYAWDYMKDDE